MFHSAADPEGVKYLFEAVPPLGAPIPLFLLWWLFFLVNIAMSVSTV